MESGLLWYHPEIVSSCKRNWVFKKLRMRDGDIERFKARLVAYGNEQVFDMDYGLTFAAVMGMSTVKFILALALRWGGYLLDRAISLTRMLKPKRNNTWKFI